MSSSSRYENDDDRFDGLYMQVASAAHGIEPLLDTVFSFLRRKTDFFDGPPTSEKRNADDDDDASDKVGTQKAIDKVNEVLKKHAELHLREKKRKRRQQQDKKQKSNRTSSAATAAKKKPGASSGGSGGADKKESTTKAVVTPQPSTQQKSAGAEAAAAASAVGSHAAAEPEVLEMGADGGFDASSPAATAPPSDREDAAAASVAAAAAASGDGNADDEEENNVNAADRTSRDDGKDKSTEGEKVPDDDGTVGGDGTDSGLQVPNAGNGGYGPNQRYEWTQTLSELAVNIPVPSNTRGKDLDVDITRNALKIKLRSSNDYIVNGKLNKQVVVDDSFWTVEDDGSRLVVNLQKLNPKEWWDCVCQDDDKSNKIDVKKIVPETSSLNDLNDGELRQTVEKMMYDQHQKAMGKPTSDEQQKQQMLQKFMSQHPEMDFSNAKIG